MDFEVLRKAECRLGYSCEGLYIFPYENHHGHKIIQNCYSGIQARIEIGDLPL